MHAADPLCSNDKNQYCGITQIYVDHYTIFPTYRGLYNTFLYNPTIFWIEILIPYLPPRNLRIGNP